MTSKREIAQLVRKLRNSSLMNDGQVSDARVMKLVSLVKEQYPSQAAQLLKAYKKELENYLRTHTAIIETTSPLTDSQRTHIDKEIKKRIDGYVDIQVVDNPHLIGGIKVTINDTMYDYSVRGKFEQMKGI